MEHLDASGGGSGRAVVIGAGGFVGGAIVKALTARGVPTVSLSRGDVDLLCDDSADRLADRLNDDDAVVFVSASAPVKTYAMFQDNIVMMKNALDALSKKRLSQVLYVSSDAVYSDSPNPLTEISVTGPDNLHGIMHIARETMLRATLDATPLAFLRPTLIYGAADPHNGYGPNQFRRLAQDEKPITLFGEGEERRDHVAVEDVAELAARIIMNRSVGILNAVTGTVTSFMEIAKMTVVLADKDIEIRRTDRNGPMPHNGYRPFDASRVAKAFPDFRFLSLEDGLRKMYEATKG